MGTICILGKTICNIRQKGVPPLLLPASVLQLPRCLVRICNLFLTNHKIADLTVSKNAIAAGKTDCKIEFAPQMWATRPHLGSIFEKLLHRKTFCLPASRILQPNFYVAFMSCNVSRETLLLGKPPKSGSARLEHIPSLPWESQLPLKPCISLQPSDFEGNCDSLRFSPRFLLQFHSTVRFAPQMWATRPHLGSIFEKLLHRKTFISPVA